MKSKYANPIKFTVLFVLIGQLIFALVSSGFTTEHYVSRIYATTGVQHKQEDLHKLNEAAHYFGQTIIGWLKFPNFISSLKETVELPEEVSVSAHIQERQNIIFTVDTDEPIELETLMAVKDYVQSKIDQYNSVSQTEFVLTNFDYEQLEIRKTYGYGASVAFLISLALAAAVLFIRKELF